MKRWFVATLSMTSLALCLATCVLWLQTGDKWRGFYRNDERVLHQSALWAIAISTGSLWIDHERYDATNRQNAGSRLWWGTESSSDPPLFAMSDDTYFTGGPGELRHRWPAWYSHGAGQDSEQLWVCPLWIVVAGFAVMPACWLISIVRGRLRTSDQICRRCGYDLRASTERCPECGEVPRT